MRKIGKWGATVVGLGLMAAAAGASAGTGTTPASVWIDKAIVLKGIAEVRIIEAAGAPYAVMRGDATTAGSGGITLIRGGNHKIPGPTSGSLDLLRTLGDPTGAVFVWYTAPGHQGGHVPHLRKIAADNQLGFDATLMVERLAGIAPDGAGGAYVASHVRYASSGVIADMTAHRTYRLSPAGEVMWQVNEPGTRAPNTSSEFWTTATQSAEGVYVGYGVTGEGEMLRPVLLHRKADGTVLWKREGLKAPAQQMMMAADTGAVGSTPLLGRVDTVHIAADGTPIVEVYRDGAGTRHLTRVDATGQQTAVFKCDGGVQELPGRELGCVTMGPGASTLSVQRYGVQDGQLVRRPKFTSQAIEGWTFDGVMATSGGQFLAAGQKNDGFGLVLFSGTGVPLAKYAQGIKGTLRGMWAGDRKILAFTSESEGERLRVEGTYSPGGTPPQKLQPQKLPLPRAGVLPP